MPDIRPGVREVRVRDQAGAFQKKTQQTGKRDLDLAVARLRELTRSRP